MKGDRAWIGLAAAAALLAAGVGAEETALDRYVAKRDPNYSFEHYRTEPYWDYTTYFIRMTSQQWRSAAEVDRPVWTHDVLITVPESAASERPETALLFIDGGSNGGSPPAEADEIAGLAAVLLDLPVVVVRQVPNQPLRFADEPGRSRSEDALLAYSLDKYLTTGDEEWPVHLAMTKAAVRAMDTAQLFMLEHLMWIRDFIVVGGSKRGWTTWLLAAVDPRVRAILPASIDILNIEPQLDHHWDAYGFYAPAIEDYVAFDLFCRMKTPEGRALLDIVDPYSYRDRYTMPKLIASSAGDQFFLPDSSRFYYDDLPEPKLLRYSINTDHTQARPTVVFTALGWVRDIVVGRDTPNYTWRLLPNGGIWVRAFTTPKRVLLRYATNPDARDFRLETLGPAWKFQRLRPVRPGVYIGYRPSPEQGWTAYTVELTFAGANGEPDQVYTTDVRVTPDTLPYAGTHCRDQEDTP